MKKRRAQPLFELHEVQAADKITLRGVLARPVRRARRGTGVAALWVHGLTGSFYSGATRLKEIAAALDHNDVALAAFNTRGHDVAASYGVSRSKKHIFAGGGFERFEDCLKDIRAAVNFLSREGYKKVFLIGHSTGANKSAYYAARAGDRRVKGAALIGPLSDTAIEMDRLGKKFKANLTRAKNFAAKNGRGAVLPASMGPHFMSAGRYLSLATPGGKEDVFPYYNPQANWKVVSKIKTPLAVIVGSKDQYLSGRRAKDLIAVFESRAAATRAFTGIIVPGANHGFSGTEKKLAQAVAAFISGALKA